MCAKAANVNVSFETINISQVLASTITKNILPDIDFLCC